MKCKSTVQYEPVMTTMEYAGMDRAAKIIQNAWREWYYEQVIFYVIQKQNANPTF